MMVTLLGFLAGTMIGLTGTGGGVLLTPLLLIFTPYPAVVIIGTDIVNGAATKLLGVIEHRRLGQVHWRLAGFLVAGSLPGTLGGMACVGYLKAHLPVAELDQVLRIVLAVALFVVGLVLPFVRGGQERKSPRPYELDSRGKIARLIGVGALVGFLVALTSIGSGSLLMLFLLMLIPLPVAGLVGTDIAFGLATMALAGSFHVWMGHFDGILFLQLVTGSLPGVILGSRFSRYLSEKRYGWIYTALYITIAARLVLR